MCKSTDESQIREAELFQILQKTKFSTLFSILKGRKIINWVNTNKKMINVKVMSTLGRRDRDQGWNWEA